MNTRISRFTQLLAIGVLAATSVQAGSLEPPAGPVSATRPPETCFDNTGNRFVDCGDGTIKDTDTGLRWLKNAECFGTRTWADANKDAANLAHGQCGLTDGSLPGDWRLPSLECPMGGGLCTFAESTGEFTTIFKPSCPSPFIPNTAGTGCWSEGDPFSSVQATSVYWSSTTVSDNTVSAWIARFLTAFTATAGKSGPTFLWPVRDGN